MNKLLLYLAFIAIGYYKLQAQNIDLSVLDGTDGLVISSLSTHILASGNVNYAGDINKDGFNDVLLWTQSNLYLIYGTSGPSQVNLSNLNSTQGFLISGATQDAFSGTGDVNGDKIDDLIIGNAVDNSVCVIFGSQLAFQNINVTDCGNATFGIKISGCPANYTGCVSGFDVSGAGDINGDNIQDMLISNNLAGPSNRSGAGLAYVLFGNEGGLSNIDLTNLTNTQGFSILGTAGSNLGTRISKAGDVNGDGIDDIFVSTFYGFPAYVIYGNTNGFSDMDLANFNSSQGFTISVTNQSLYGRAISNAGDVNGDLIDDLLIGLDDGEIAWAYVLYGSKNMSFNVTITDITSAQGFSIITNQAISLGADVSHLGDFNQDGLDDVVISAYNDDNGAGAAYVIFGTKSQPASINIDSFPSSQGIAIIGADPFGETGYIVSGIGDFNGDNIPDIALGTYSDIASGYVLYSPYGSNPKPKSAERIGYKALFTIIMAFIVCML